MLQILLQLNLMKVQTFLNMNSFRWFFDMFITSSFERFVEFIDCSAESSAEEIAKIVLSKIEQYGVGNKLVAQTYGGASVMSGENSGVNVRIKEEYLEALFVHCYAHKLNFVSLQSVKEISACKRFFSTLTGISAFFSRLTRGSSHLHTFVTLRMPRAAETHCNTGSRRKHRFRRFLPRTCSKNRTHKIQQSTPILRISICTMSTGHLRTNRLRNIITINCSQESIIVYNRSLLFFMPPRQKIRRTSRQPFLPRLFRILRFIHLTIHLPKMWPSHMHIMFVPFDERTSRHMQLSYNPNFTKRKDIFSLQTSKHYA